jgi:hypothetical protein
LGLSEFGQLGNYCGEALGVFDRVAVGRQFELRNTQDCIAFRICDEGGQVIEYRPGVNGGLADGV